MCTGPSVSESPGLVACAVYLRPAKRAEALATLVDLGMFVREYQGQGAEGRIGEPADILLIFAEAQVPHLQLIKEATTRGALVIVLLADGTWAETFEHSGAFAVLPESAEPLALRKTFADAGLIARQRRSAARVPGASMVTSVFGGLEFHPNEPWLTRDGNLAGLSPTEFGVLRALVAARGAVVPKPLLQRQLSASNEPASDGYLKTVVLRLRRKVEQLGGDPGRLSAVRGAGYVLRG